MIVLENLHKTLDGLPILRGVDLRVEPGETLVIVGSSGTGKSVTLKHILGLMRADQGRVLVDGDDVGAASGAALRRIRDKFGVLFQSGALIAWMTVAENVALPLYEKTRLGDDEIRAEVRAKLELVGMYEARGKRPADISGGMRKRAALARALITAPRILLYDEPTSGLDPILSRNVDRLIRDTQQRFGVTSVVVTHDLVSAFTIGDRVAMLHEGRVAEVGTPQAFAASDNPVVREFVQAQFQTEQMKELGL